MTENVKSFKEAVKRFLQDSPALDLFVPGTSTEIKAALRTNDCVYISKLLKELPKQTAQLNFVKRHLGRVMPDKMANTPFTYNELACVSKNLDTLRNRYSSLLDVLQCAEVRER